MNNRQPYNNIIKCFPEAIIVLVKKKKKASLYRLLKKNYGTEYNYNDEIYIYVLENGNIFETVGG